jgi:hypothetical protein
MEIFVLHHAVSGVVDISCFINKFHASYFSRPCFPNYRWALAYSTDRGSKKRLQKFDEGDLIQSNNFEVRYEDGA